MTVYAGFWLRGVAYLIDSILVGVIVFVVAGLGIVPMADDPEAEPLLSALNFLAEAIALLYWSIFEASALQATPGKLAVGIRVTDLAGGRLGFGRALLRNVLKILSFLLLLIGYLMAAFTARKQALHDLLAGTLVVKRGAAPPAAGTAAGGGEPRLSGTTPQPPHAALVPTRGGARAFRSRMWYTYVLAASAIRPASRMGATPRPASGAVAVLPSPWGGAGGGASAVASPRPAHAGRGCAPLPLGRGRGRGFGGAAAVALRNEARRLRKVGVRGSLAPYAPSALRFSR